MHTSGLDVLDVNVCGVTQRVERRFVLGFLIIGEDDASRWHGATHPFINTNLNAKITDSTE